MTIDEIRNLGKEQIDWDRHVALFGKDKANNVLYFWMKGFEAGQLNPNIPTTPEPAKLPLPCGCNPLDGEGCVKCAPSV